MMDEYAILNAVAQAFHLTPEIIKSKKRSQRIAHARQVAMYLIREDTKLSTVEIGEFLNRDHSTVIHGWKIIAMRVAGDRAFLWAIGQIKAGVPSKERWSHRWGMQA